MIDVEELYFDWLMNQIDPDGVTEGVAHVCGLLHNRHFKRRVGNDVNRAIDGINLRREFLQAFDEVKMGVNVANELMAQECSWLEMLLPLARSLDYLYDGGVDGRMYELLDNLGLMTMAEAFEPMQSEQANNFDMHRAHMITDRVDNNDIDPDGHGGIFPLKGQSRHVDQRQVEIWDQHSAYFREKLEGVWWTSSN